MFWVRVAWCLQPHASMCRIVKITILLASPAPNSQNKSSSPHMYVEPSTIITLAHPVRALTSVLFVLGNTCVCGDDDLFWMFGVGQTSKIGFSFWTIVIMFISITRFN